MRVYGKRIWGGKRRRLVKREAKGRKGGEQKIVGNGAGH